jgi:putative tryptophan/tyrosine transport system substrate-binding protein
VVAATVLGPSATIEPQGPVKSTRIGILMTPPEFTVGRVGFALLRRPRLQMHGESAVHYERRYGSREDPERLRAAARDVVAADVDVIVALGRAATLAARDVTQTVPIVMLTRADPAAATAARSVGGPGGNVTGITTLNPDLIVARVALLHDAVPGLRRLTVLRASGDREDDEEFRHTDAEARRLGIELVVVEAGDSHAVETALGRAAANDGGAVLALSGAALRLQGVALPELAMKHRVPVMYPDESFVSLGAHGLMSFGPNVDIAERVWAFVDRILDGVAPADLPIEVAAKFDLVVNLKTARALGLTIPPAVLLRADHVVE